MPVEKINTAGKNRWISGFLFLIAAILLAVEISPIINFSFTGVLPEIIAKTNHPTSVVYALDLTLVVPVSIVAGYWLWKKKPWGIVLSAIMLVKAAAYGLVLSAGTILMLQLEYDPLLPFYIFIAVGGVTGLILLLKSINLSVEVVKEALPGNTASDVLKDKSKLILYN